MRKYEDCMYCMNSRPIVSENGIHYSCVLKHKETMLCRFGDKDYFVRLPLFKKEKSDENA